MIALFGLDDIYGVAAAFIVIALLVDGGIDVNGTLLRSGDGPRHHRSEDKVVLFDVK